MVQIKFIKSKKTKTLRSCTRNEEPIDFTEVTDEPARTEYHETLHSQEDGGHTTTETPLFVRDVQGIENTVDVIHHTSDSKLETNLEKKVDSILANKPVYHQHDRKPSNVIYVVSKPQPGQVKGDWAVRGHGKIYSHHRTKLAAIAKAREVAKKRDATVLVQRTDGTFSEGFKPRTKKP
jgi:hypothetical protein